MIENRLLGKRVLVARDRAARSGHGRAPCAGITRRHRPRRAARRGRYRYCFRRNSAANCAPDISICPFGARPPRPRCLCSCLIFTPYGRNDGQERSVSPSPQSVQLEMTGFSRELSSFVQGRRVSQAESTKAIMARRLLVLLRSRFSASASGIRRTAFFVKRCNGSPGSLQTSVRTLIFGSCRPTG